MPSLTREKWGDVAELNRSQRFSLGPINTESLLLDPKHLCFTLSRYKFALKTMAGKKHVLEIGCGEGLGAFFFCNQGQSGYTGVDFDADQIDYARREVRPYLQGPADFIQHDLIEAPVPGVSPDAVVMLDVVEHIHPQEESQFWSNCFSSLAEGGLAIVGTPNVSAHSHASLRSREGHINLFDAERLKEALGQYFRNVFVFSMNDEIVHTGFSPMAHYLMALCVR